MPKAGSVRRSGIVPAKKAQPAWPAAPNVSPAEHEGEGDDGQLPVERAVGAKVPAMGEESAPFPPLSGNAFDTYALWVGRASLKTLPR